MPNKLRVLEGAIEWDTTAKKDVYPVVEDPAIRRLIIEALVEKVNASYDYVAGIEATGFVFGSMLAERLNAGFVAVRRKSKWPYEDHQLVTQSCTDYSGSSKTFAVRHDQINEGDSILVVDDWVETGSQYRCVKALLEQEGASVTQALCLVMELSEETRDLLGDVSPLAVIE